MTTHQELAEQMIGQLEEQLQSASVESINKMNRVIFAKELRDNLVEFGFDEEEAKGLIFNMDIKISEDVPLETVLYLALKYARLITKMHSVYEQDEFLLEWMMSRSFSIDME